MTTVVYVANAESRDIAVLVADSAGGPLQEVDRFAAGGDVMPLAASPDRRTLYAALRGEPFDVLSLRIDAASGRLEEIARTPLPARMCWIATDRSGRFLLSASYRGDRVAVSPIAADGAVRAAQQIVPGIARAHAVRSVPTQAQPRGFTVSPDGRFLYAVGQASHRLSRYGIDAASGRLNRLGDQAVGRDPNWVEIVELAA